MVSWLVQKTINLPSVGMNIAERQQQRQLKLILLHFIKPFSNKKIVQIILFNLFAATTRHNVQTSKYVQSAVPLS